MKKFLMGLLCTIFAFQVNATDGDFTNVRDHQNWSSGEFYINGDYLTRIVNAKTIGNEVFGIILDFYPNGRYDTEIMVHKTEDRYGSSLPVEGIVRPCEVRVDSMSLFRIKCRISDDYKMFHIGLSKGLDGQFIKECKQGHTLRIKADLPEKPIYFNFRLNGFTAAYNRAVSLVRKNDDSSYFEDNSSFTPIDKHPSTNKSDASYFEI